MKLVWNSERDNLLRRHYPKRDLDWVAGRIGVSKAALKSRAQILGIQRKVHQRVPWTDRQLAYLRKHYADMRAEDIARKVRQASRGAQIENYTARHFPMMGISKAVTEEIERIK